MKKNRILYLSGASFKNPTAQLIHVLKMSSALCEFYEVDLFVFNKNKDTNLSSYSLVSEPNIISFNIKKISVSLQLIYALFKQLLKFRYKAIITRNVVVAFICSILNIKFVYETHDAFRGTLKNIFESRVFKSKSLIKFVVISKRLAMDYKDLFDCYPEVCHDAADIFSPAIPIRNEVKKVFYVGSLYRGRGIEIIQKLAMQNKDLDFHIYGGKKSYSEQNMHYHGFASQIEIQEAVSNADILLMPYQTKLETANGGIDTARWMSPMKMFEYMSFGVPIISSDLPVLREVLNSQNSVLVEPSNVKNWNDALVNLRNNRSLRSKIATNAKKDHKNHYTWSQRAKVFHEFISIS